MTFCLCQILVAGASKLNEPWNLPDHKDKTCSEITLDWVGRRAWLSLSGLRPLTRAFQFLLRETDLRPVKTYLPVTKLNQLHVLPSVPVSCISSLVTFLFPLFFTYVKMYVALHREGLFLNSFLGSMFMEKSFFLSLSLLLSSFEDSLSSVFF